VPPEPIFNQGLGDLFVVRTAGAVADQAVLGSMEYAAEHLHVPLVVVMGHTSCGAVKAAMETPAPAKPDPAQLNLERILSAIRPSLPGTPGHGNAWADAVYASTEHSLSDVVHHSPVLAHMGESGAVLMVSAVYELESGKVHFSKPLEFHAAHSRVTH
jgi:carbonic anhydrase